MIDWLTEPADIPRWLYLAVNAAIWIGVAVSRWADRQHTRLVDTLTDHIEHLSVVRLAPGSPTLEWCTTHHSRHELVLPVKHLTDNGVQDIGAYRICLEVAP